MSLRLKYKLPVPIIFYLLEFYENAECYQSINQLSPLCADLEDCMGVREVKPLFESGEEMLSMREVMVLATSGLTGDGVVEGIDWIAQCIVRNIHVRQGNSDYVLFLLISKVFCT